MSDNGEGPRTRSTNAIAAPVETTQALTELPSEAALGKGMGSGSAFESAGPTGSVSARTSDGSTGSASEGPTGSQWVLVLGLWWECNDRNRLVRVRLHRSTHQRIGRNAVLILACSDICHVLAQAGGVLIVANGRRFRRGRQCRHAISTVIERTACEVTVPVETTGRIAVGGIAQASGRVRFADTGFELVLARRGWRWCRCHTAQQPLGTTQEAQQSRRRWARV
jgi:hypothetical protein